jgi:trimeric autotransporter adhesin
MKTAAFFVLAAVMSLPAFSQTSAPPAPSLTAGAEFKGLRFDWDAVPGASWYQLELRAHENGAFVQQGDDFPATTTSARFSFPLHLFDWTYARYRLAACNSAGCSRSAAVSVSGSRRYAVGYFKSRSSIAGGQLGSSMDLTPDGYTLVAAAPGEPSSANSSARGRIYVFRRGSDRQWIQRASLDARMTTAYNSYVSLGVAVSASGNTVAVSMPAEVVDPATQRRGQVDIYNWTNNAYIPTRLPRPPMDEILTADLDDSGYLLAVAGRLSGQHVTAIYKSTNGVWANVANVSTNDSCWNVKLTQDGKKLAATCRSGEGVGPWRDYVRVLSGSNWSMRSEIELDRPLQPDAHYHMGFGLDRTGNVIAVHSGDEHQGGPSVANVKVYQWDGSGYQFVTLLRSGEWNSDDDNLSFGESISISGNGLTMAIGHSSDYGMGLGPRAAPLNAGTVPTGGVFIYRFTNSWKLANMVKPNYIDPSAPYAREFGRITALNGSGKTLVVAVPGEDSSASGIGGNWANSSMQGSGALFMY